MAEIGRRLRLLLDVGLEYLTLNRRSDSLSGGESQRIRLSIQIIELGPEGEHRGGQVIACGTPKDIARAPGSHTGRYLAKVLG